MLHSITLENYRCFSESQTVRLAPLTLLVGENSTGKTSFLAMVRALRDFALGVGSLNFKKDPYDLGSFDEIAHFRGDRGGRADKFEAGFTSTLARRRSSSRDTVPYSFEITFRRGGVAPVPVGRRITLGKDSIEERIQEDKYVIIAETQRGTWKRESPTGYDNGSAPHDNPKLRHDLFLVLFHFLHEAETGERKLKPLSGSPDFSQEDGDQLRDLVFAYRTHFGRRTFAGAPVRSKPKRTYDPASPVRDPEGDYVPMYLADISSQDEQTWKNLKQKLEAFGQDAGLFDEISIRRWGTGAGQPFQVEIKKFGKEEEGPAHNLIDVGYGVSQVLPIVTELLRKDAPGLLLLQQPEVHLHPRAQAALGSLFCKVASPGHQLVVETHSDYLLDRISMEVRGIDAFDHNDVSILFFERENLGVRIHQLKLDEMGNFLGAPKGYRAFFRKETERFLGLDT